VKVERPDQVWSADITYVPPPAGFMYLAAVIDWFSRYVIAWRLSNTFRRQGRENRPPPPQMRSSIKQAPFRCASSRRSSGPPAR
jgi:transposase InsO family protein